MTTQDKPAVGSCSYIKNCFIHARDVDRPLFSDEHIGPGMLVRLDGYAIVPREKYDALVSNVRLAPTAPVETLGETAAGSEEVQDAASFLRKAFPRSAAGFSSAYQPTMAAVQTVLSALIQPDTGKVEAGRVEQLDAGFEAWLTARDLLPGGECDWPQIVAMLDHHEQALRPQPSGETREAPNLVERLRGWPHHVEGADYSVASIQALMNEAANTLITPADQAKGGAK